MLSESLINEFKEIYKKEYGVDLPTEELVQKATGLFNLFKAFSKVNKQKTIDTLPTI